MYKPTVLAFAGPNGSGKSTVTKNLAIYGEYVNADDLKKNHGLTDIEAAQKAEALRNGLLEKKVDFTFETVMSTERNLLLLQKARRNGYRVLCVYVLTHKADINVARVKARVRAGGHNVPEDKIRSRYRKALELLPQLIDVCDEIIIYDNSEKPVPIFQKEKDSFSGMGVISPTKNWPVEKLEELLKCEYCNRKTGTRLSGRYKTKGVEQ